MNRMQHTRPCAGCGKITRNHARNPEYPENQERGA